MLYTTKKQFVTMPIELDQMIGREILTIETRDAAERSRGWMDRFMQRNRNERHSEDRDNDSHRLQMKRF